MRKGRQEPRSSQQEKGIIRTHPLVEMASWPPQPLLRCCKGSLEDELLLDVF